MSENRTDAGIVLLAFVAGAAIGAGLAFLFAPRSGKETRDRILDFADRAKRSAEDLASRLGHGQDDEMST